jgi:hypothetical protein
LPRLTLNCHPAHLCLLNCWDYRCEPQHSVCIFFYCFYQEENVSEKEEKERTEGWKEMNIYLTDY